jgi:hypothetical protein
MNVKDFVVEYCDGVRTLLTNPAEFFSQSGSLPGYQVKLLFALPPILVYSIAESILQKNPWLSILYFVAAYAYIGIWMTALKFVLVVFGEKRTFDETLYISASASFVFLIAWIPNCGAPIAALGAGLWTVFGLTHGFKMNNGAAVAAVALPAVVTGVAGMAFTWLLVLLTTPLQMMGSQ